MIRELECPYGDDFEGGDECDRCEQYELCMESYPPLNLIEIPKGATNGDMIKVMFPSVEIHQSGGYTSCLFQPSVMLEDTKSDWWNAPYKRGSEE